MPLKEGIRYLKLQAFTTSYCVPGYDLVISFGGMVGLVVWKRNHGGFLYLQSAPPLYPCGLLVEVVGRITIWAVYRLGAIWAAPVLIGNRVNGWKRLQTSRVMGIWGQCMSVCVCLLWSPWVHPTRCMQLTDLLLVVYVTCFCCARLFRLFTVSWQPPGHGAWSCPVAL